MFLSAYGRLFDWICIKGTARNSDQYLTAPRTIQPTRSPSPRLRTPIIASIKSSRESSPTHTSPQEPGLSSLIVSFNGSRSSGRRDRTASPPLLPSMPSPSTQGDRRPEAPVRIVSPAPSNPSPIHSSISSSTVSEEEQEEDEEATCSSATDRSDSESETHNMSFDKGTCAPGIDPNFMQNLKKALSGPLTKTFRELCFMDDVRSTPTMNPTTLAAPSPT